MPTIKKAGDLPEQTGRVVVITGANSGLGYESARAYARKGAQVVMAVRDVKRGETARARILQSVPQANITVMELDLASLASIHSFADSFNRKYDRLDILHNNAGIMAIPRSQTKDGFETQFGVNHLGHFALTGLLLPIILATPGSRIVTTSSSAHTFGRINFADLQSQHRYGRWRAYGQSKIANILFTLELQRKLVASGSTTLSLVAHPGYASTGLQGTSATTSNAFIEKLMYSVMNASVAQSGAMGALPQLYAATMPDVQGGEFYGPRFFVRGYPVRSRAVKRAYDRDTAARLWQVSEELTGVKYTFEKKQNAQGAVAAK